MQTRDHPVEQQRALVLSCSPLPGHLPAPKRGGVSKTLALVSESIAVLVVRHPRAPTSQVFTDTSDKGTHIPMCVGVVPHRV